MAKVIMVQGTMSNAGKSVMAAGLCRIFHQDGYRVAPFKSQNMALNSFITKEGLEMGRAQVMQAEAAGVEPEVAMNPILLKPTNDIGSQVIVNGEVLGTMNARDYFKMKQSLIPDILKAYHHLEEKYDIIVIEGAGSPAEINLKQDDIVNMGMAKLVDAPVLLVGDIDRGGVFAQLYGTVELLEPEEKARIRGLIINKFRGDKTILDPGVEMLEKLTGIPVVGVAPYLKVSLEDEDSLSERLDGDQQVGQIDIAVIRVPRISNFTDFNVFEGIEGVTVRYVKEARELGHPDLIILPGTKNTMRDLLWMRQNGLEAQILKAQKAGTAIFGVCGGYQMLGMEISDPDGVEEGGVIRVAAEQYSSPTSAKMLADFIMKMIDANEYGIYHASCEGCCSRVEAAEEILRLMGQDPTGRIEAVPSESGKNSPRNTFLRNLMMEVTGIYRMPWWQDAMKEYIQELRG